MWGIRNSMMAKLVTCQTHFMQRGASRDDRAAREQIDATQYQTKQMILPPGHASLTDPSVRPPIQDAARSTA